MAHSVTPGLYFGDEDVMYKQPVMANAPVSLELVAGSDMLAPVYHCANAAMLLINYNGNNLATNYIYDAFWGRYYFVRNKVSENGAMIALHCELDPLMSHKNIIADWQVFVVRNGNDSAWGYVPDNQYPVDPNRCVNDVIDFGQGVLDNDTTSANYVLTVI